MSDFTAITRAPSTPEDNDRQTFLLVVNGWVLRETSVAAQMRLVRLSAVVGDPTEVMNGTAADEEEA